MPAIKITLSRLIELFGKSVNTVELPEPVRALAARLMTLTAHVVRIDQKIDAQVKILSEQIATLTDIMQSLAQPQQATSATASGAPVDAAPVLKETPAGDIASANDEEDSEDAFIARAQAEAAAEVAAINDAAPVAEVTPLPRSKKAGGAK